MHTAVSGVRYAELEHAFERSSGASLHISLSSEPDFRSIPMTRSEDTTVSLDSEDLVNPRNTRHSTLELLARHSDKVRSLFLGLQYPDYVDVLRLIPMNGPQLLSLTARVSDWRSLHPEEPDIPNILTSRLQHLSLDGFCIPWSTKPFPKSLTTLKIEAFRFFDLSNRQSWQDFFDALEGLSQLTNLDLAWDVSLGLDDPHESELPFIESTVHFPQLDIVRLEGCALACAYLLEHFVTPVSTRLLLAITDGPEEEDSIMTPRLFTSFTSFTNIERELGPFVLNLWFNTISAVGVDTVVPSTDDLFSAPQRDDHLRIWMMEIEDTGHESDTEILLKMCSYSWVHAAREIHISCGHMSPHKDLWRRVLRSTPHLQSIHCEKMQFRTLPSLLSESHTATETATAVPLSDKFLVPTLSKLNILLSTITKSEDGDPSTVAQQIEDWCEMFRGRREAGCADIRLELRDTRRRPRLESEVQSDDLQLARLREVTEVVVV